MSALAVRRNRWWWVWLLTGSAWMVAGLVVLRFDAASVRTAGVIIGCMLLALGAQQLALAVLTDAERGLSIAFGVVFAISGLVCLAGPAETVAGFADMLGFMILAVAVWTMIEAFLVRERNSLWWLLLLGGLVGVALAYWISGKFLIEKAYTLLVLVGVWALVHGAGDFVRAFAARSGRDGL